MPARVTSARSIFSPRPSLPKMATARTAAAASRAAVIANARRKPPLSASPAGRPTAALVADAAGHDRGDDREADGAADGAGDVDQRRGHAGAPGRDAVHGGDGHGNVEDREAGSEDHDGADDAAEKRSRWGDPGQQHQAAGRDETAGRGHVADADPREAGRPPTPAPATTCSRSSRRACPAPTTTSTAPSTAWPTPSTSSPTRTGPPPARHSAAPCPRRRRGRHPVRGPPPPHPPRQAPRRPPRHRPRLRPLHRRRHPNRQHRPARRPSRAWIPWRALNHGGHSAPGPRGFHAPCGPGPRQRRPRGRVTSAQPLWPIIGGSGGRPPGLAGSLTAAAACTDTAGRCHRCGPR